MKINTKLAALLSDFFLDIAKAFFVATFITPSLSGISSLPEIIFVLTKGMLNVIVYLLLAWLFARVKDYE